MPVRKTYEEVFEAFRERGYMLITEDYRNNKQRLKYKCPRHPKEVQTTRYNDLQNGHGCNLCGRERIIENLREQSESQRLKYEDVKEEIENEGFSLLSTKYINAQQTLEVECPKHKGIVIKIRICDFRNGTKRCRRCVNESQRTPFHKVVEEYKGKGYILLETEYKNQVTPMRYICSKHPYEIKEITLDSVKGGSECFECAIEKVSGKNSVHYNHELTDEDREFDRRYDPKERQWRAQVFRRDNYTCQKCGGRDDKVINSHHKDAHHWCVERRYDVTNGVTLCIECHKEFHKIYGYKNNTEEQYDEWNIEKGRR